MAQAMDAPAQVAHFQRLRRWLAEHEGRGDAVGAAELDDWFRVVPEDKGHATLRARMALECLDLSTGPSRVRRPAEDARKYVSRRSGLPAAKPIGPMFLHTGSLSATSTDDLGLDGFAARVVDEPGFDGVYLVAGVRGSGKSTLLNRVHEYCVWYEQDAAGRAPLVVRVDVSSTFDDQKFTLDLASQICQDAMKRMRQPPYRRGAIRDFVTLAVGHAARWCQANLAWALWMSALIGFLLVAEAVRRGDRAAELIAQSAAAPERKGIAGEVWDNLSATSALLSAIVGVGLVESVRRSGWKLRGAAEGLRPAPSLVVLVVILALFALAAIPMLSLLGAINMEGWGLGLTTGWSAAQKLFAATGLAVVLICIGVWTLLPEWWTEYVRLRKLFLALRARQDQNAPDLPYFGTLAGIVRGFLPRGDDDEEAVRELSVPMLQEQLKNVLFRVSKVFGRVVFLIDDVDVMPSDRFHALMRIIRPFTKVDGVRCVVAVPTYFFDEFQSSLLGDLHSTARDALLLGSSSLYGGFSTGFQPRTPSPQEFLKSVQETAIARVRVRVDWGVKPAHESRLIQEVLSGWRASTPKWQPHLADWVHQVGQSRRELIREIAKELATRSANSLTPDANVPLSSIRAELRRCYEQRARDGKIEFGRTETALKAQESPSGPKEIRLVGPSSQPDSAPQVLIDLKRPPTAAAKGKGAS